MASRSIDFMYSDDAALSSYEDFSKIPVRLMKRAREQFFPKATMWPDEVKGLDLVLADALKNKFIAAALTPDQINEMVQIPKPLR
jgi:NitT/TauT family transport system substrate-binding protein